MTSQKIPVITSSNGTSNNITSMSSFAYSPPPAGPPPAPISSAQSPTISLLSSSSPSNSQSSPTSSPTLFKMNEKNRLIMMTGGMGNGSKQQQPVVNSKLINSSLNDSNGVACQIVKSNTNIYYNLKVDSAASRAIHYSDNCTNSDCKAIHKSLSRSVQTGEDTSGRSRLNSTGSNKPLTRIFLAPANSAIATQASQQMSKNGASIVNGLPNNAANNRLSNINFVFERRYPAAQLNSNFLSAPGGSSSQGGDRPLSPNRVSSSTLSSRKSSASGDEHSSLGSFPLPLSPSMHHAMAAAAAIAAHHHQTGLLDPNKTFSINFNRLPANATSSNTNRSSAAATLAQQLQQRQQQMLQQLTKSQNELDLLPTSPSQAASSASNNTPNSGNIFDFNFPSLIADLDKLRSRNMSSFFDQVRLGPPLKITFILSPLLRSNDLQPIPVLYYLNKL